IKQINNYGLTLEKVTNQIDIIKHGMEFSVLVEPAGIGNGILKVQTKFEEYINEFDSKRDKLSIVKFVPASGAASRMFKFLFQFLKDYDPNKESIEDYTKKNKDISVFVNGLEKLPFFEIVKNKALQTHPNYKNLSLGEQCVLFVKTMLDANQLNYSFFPKGLLPFHKYKTGVSTAFKEHLLEATLCASSNNIANLHFTVSEAHTEMFHNELGTIKEKLEKEANITFDVSFSYQSKSTDTIAITASDELYRNADGSLLFRPSGHGALIENLNTLNY